MTSRYPSANNVDVVIVVGVVVDEVIGEIVDVELRWRGQRRVVVLLL
jgi:hypothetical protein